MARPRSEKATGKRNPGGRKATKDAAQAPVEQVSEEQVAGVAVMEGRNAPVGVAQVAGSDDGGAAYQAAIEALNGRFDTLEKEVRHLAGVVEEGQVSMRSDFRSDVIHVERLVGAVTDRVAAIEAYPSTTKVFDKIAEEAAVADEAVPAQAYEQTMSASYASTGTETVDLVDIEPVTPPEVLLELETEEPDVATETVVEEVVDEVPAGEVVEESEETESVVEDVVDEALEEETDDEETEDLLKVILEEIEGEAEEDDEETEDEVVILEEIEDEDDEDDEDDDTIVVVELDDEEDVEEEEQVVEVPVAATNGTAGGGTGGSGTAGGTAGAWTGGGTLTPVGLLALVLQAEAERPNHRIGRRRIAAAVRSVAQSGTPSRSLSDARRLLAAHEHIVAIWDELPDGPSGGSHEARA
jgi:hypothetical protein